MQVLLSSPRRAILNVLEGEDGVAEGGDGGAVGDEDHCFLREGTEEAAVEFGFGLGV